VVAGREKKYTIPGRNPRVSAEARIVDDEYSMTRAHSEMLPGEDSGRTFVTGHARTRAVAVVSGTRTAMMWSGGTVVPM
jgi:hypothetical protein